MECIIPVFPGSTTVENKGAYTLQVGQKPLLGEEWSVDILMGQTESVDVTLGSPVSLTAVLGRFTLCEPIELCNKTVTCTGTTLIGFRCTC